MADPPTQIAKKSHRHKKSFSTKSDSLRGSFNLGSLPPKSKKTKLATNYQKRISSHLSLRKKRIFTEKELNIPALNMITPIGVQKPKGKKKGKIFVDDRESMMTILSLVSDEKNGQLESKLAKARQKEEIREARRLESEKKHEIKKAMFNEVKNSFRKERKRAYQAKEGTSNIEIEAESKSKLKKVSFA